MKIALRGTRSPILFGLLGIIIWCVYAAEPDQRSSGPASGSAVSQARLGRTLQTQPNPSPAAFAPSVGMRDTVLAGPAIPRPAGTPCVVELFRDVMLHDPGQGLPGEGFFPYAPPAGCPGPWSKVILQASFYNENPDTYLDGVMFTSISLDGVPLYMGGAQDNDVPTHWSVERDVTDYSAVLRAPRSGTLDIEGEPRFGPPFSSPYYASATLLFYPVTPAHGAQRVPDEVHALTDIGWQRVRAPTDLVGRTLSLPRNVERAYVDVLAHPRYNYDLVWFTCMPDADMAAFPELASPLAIGAARIGLEGDPPPQGCSGGSFREVQVSIDGQPAGVAPVYPRVHPLLNGWWNPSRMFQPSPTPQALNFMPYRVDLTPFAGQLSDGAPHTVALNLASSRIALDFAVSGTLLVYRDATSAQVTGQVTRNTLAGQPPAPQVASTLSRDAAGVVSGEVRTSSVRRYAIEGYIDTSRGRIRSTVERDVKFHNVLAPRAYDPPGADLGTYELALDMTSSVDGTSRRYLDGALIAEDREVTRYPLDLTYRYLSVVLQQAFVRQTDHWRPGVAPYSARLRHETGLTYAADGAGNPTQWQGYQRYVFADSCDSCHRVSLATQGGALSGYVSGAGCPGGVNRLFWAARPDGSPGEMRWIDR
ncbi:peptide-N4-asparagine amidase [Lysobacter soli]|uniref:peptide-N4-asparagine amidase n=1 Tax=Lysobacter soli TaxID=453783 RepID=UPI0037C727A1